MNEFITGIRILFSGEYWPGANSLYIARALAQCGAIVRFLNDSAIFPGWHDAQGKLVRRLIERPVVEAEWNHQLLSSVKRFSPDLVYITNGNLCWPKTLMAIQKQNIPVMCFYHDPAWKHTGRNRFGENLPFFDLIATTRGWQAEEFRAAGAKAVSLVRFGYDPSVHRPVNLGPRGTLCYGSDLAFIGTHEPHRASELETLVAGEFSYRFRVWGNLWNNLAPNSPLRPYWQMRDVFEQEIAAIYAASKIALHWIGREPHSHIQELRKGDQHNSRTFQIAACGGALMVAQRTAEHMRFFKEDIEAIYFDNVNELRSKLAFWLDPAQDEDRRRLAASARLRCITEDYSYVPVVKRFLDHFGFQVA